MFNIITIIITFCIIGGAFVLVAKKAEELHQLIEQKKSLEQTNIRIKEEIKHLQESGKTLRKDYYQKYQEYQTLNDNIFKLNDEIEHKRKSAEDTIRNAIAEYSVLLENQSEKAEKEYDEKLNKLQNNLAEELMVTTEKLNNAKEELEKLQNSLNAGVEANLRKKEMIEKQDYYKLKVTEDELFDIKILNNIKSQLKQPVILSKLIWTTYFQKQTTELCSRIIGNGKVSGIYKITDINTNEAYIGQSVDLSTRLKSHIKCGLGIDAPTTNKLYKAMQNRGIWNFTFEVLELCPPTELNEKEIQWIELYQTNSYGFNSTKGGS